MEHFSDREAKIIKIIGKNKITIKDLSSKIFEGEEIPFDNIQTINNSVTRIIAKCEHYGLSWTLSKNKDKKENKMTVSRVSTTKTFAVRKRTNSGGFIYSLCGETWTIKEMENLKWFKLKFSEKMTNADRGIVIALWSHKLHID